MGTTSYTSNYQIKLIGSGREAGTWGDSTNEAIQRLEAAIGKTVEINILAMPIGSTNASLNGATAAEWITVDAADTSTSQSGSEGRSVVIEVTSAGGVLTSGSPHTLEIRGSSTGEVPERVLFIKNSLGQSMPLTIDGSSGADVIIRNGNWAVIAVFPTTVGNLTNGVHNILGKIQLGGASFDTAADLEFSAGASTVSLPDTQVSALIVRDASANTYIEIDTTENTVNIDQDISLEASVEAISIIEGEADSLDITAGTNSYLTFDTDGNQVVIGRETSDCDTLDVDTDTVDFGTQTTTFDLKDNEAAALTIQCDDGTDMIVFDTLDTAERVDITVPFSAPDAVFTGTDSYILFDVDEATPADGYGFRNNSGEIEIKGSTNEDWGSPYADNLVSGEGTYFKSSANAGAYASGGLVAGGTGNQTHGLTRGGVAAIPRLVLGTLVCLVADADYSIGDTIHITSGQSSDFGWGDDNANRHYGCSFWSTTTTIGFSCYSGKSGRWMYVPLKGGGSWHELEAASWDLYIECWS